MVRGGCIYIMTNRSNTTLYVGVTSDLIGRIYDHQTKEYPRSFTARYNLTKLVYYESFHSIEEAIAREKQLKAGNRRRKIDLIEKLNPSWKDLSEEVRNW
ncbi:MAG: GIY-YIG nuclease family protein [Cyclobacteriaceae bacterium]|nr:GIY-YIG nuclease family protein [Cyclobacteriaceae bacterium SS2]